MVTVNVAPALDWLSVPPGANFTIAGAAEAVPTIHGVLVFSVIARVTVHVSPGVVKLVGVPDAPSPQLLSVVIGPATEVVHAVAKLLVPMRHSSDARNNVFAVAVAVVEMNFVKTCIISDF